MIYDLDRLHVLCTGSVQEHFAKHTQMTIVYVIRIQAENVHCKPVLSVIHVFDVLVICSPILQQQ